MLPHAYFTACDQKKGEKGARNWADIDRVASALGFGFYEQVLNFFL